MQHNESVQKFSRLLVDMRNNSPLRESFNSDPIRVLSTMGIPLIGNDKDTIPPRAVRIDPSKFKIRAASPETASEPAPRLWVEPHWWGMDFCLNDPMVKKVEIGEASVDVLIGIVAAALSASGAVTGGAAAVGGAVIAAVLVLKSTETLIMDNGNGIFFRITWLQWGAVLVTVPGSPVSLAAAAVLIHPWPL